MKLPNNSVCMSDEAMMYVNGGGWKFSTLKKSVTNLSYKLPKPLGVLIKGLVSVARSFWYYAGQFALYGARLYAAIGAAAAALVVGGVAAARWMGTGVRFR